MMTTHLSTGQGVHLCGTVICNWQLDRSLRNPLIIAIESKLAHSQINLCLAMAASGNGKRHVAGSGENSAELCLNGNALAPLAGLRWFRWSTMQPAVGSD